MEKPLISVIIPVYKVEKYIDRCLNSVRNQSLKNIEIILVEDGSPDNCAHICDEYKKKDKRIIVIHKKNEGLGFARNSGLKIANGLYVVFIDSDDYIEKNMLEDMFNSINISKADTCLSGNYENYSKSKVIVKPHPYCGEIFHADTITTKLLPGMIGADSYGKGYCGMSVWRGMYSLSIIKNNDIQFPSERIYISEDIIFDLEYFKNSNLVIVADKPYYHYCKNGSSLTSTYKKDRFEKCTTLYLKLLDMIVNRNNDTFERLYNAYITNSRVCIIQEALNYKNIGLYASIKNIKEICDSQDIQKVLEKFDYMNLPYKQRVFAVCMRRKLVLMLFLLANLNK